MRSKLSISQVCEILGSESEESGKADPDDSKLSCNTEDTTLSGIKITLVEKVSLGLVNDFVSSILRLSIQESEVPIIDVSEPVSSHCYNFSLKLIYSNLINIFEIISYSSILN